MNPKDRLIVALDVDSEEKAISIVEKLKNDVRLFKVGLEIFSSCGPSVLKRIREADCEVFLDLKFHDIPNTVAKAAVSAARLDPFILNVHALGGYEMMQRTAGAVTEEAARLRIRKPKIIAVTILTSMDQKALKRTGINANIKTVVLTLAKLARDAGLDGVVASPNETSLIRRNLGDDFLIVTPGIRPASSVSHDQRRVATPKQAVKNGADFIVVGRPITEASDPAGAAKEILREIT